LWARALLTHPTAFLIDNTVSFDCYHIPARRMQVAQLHRLVAHSWGKDIVANTRRGLLFANMAHIDCNLHKGCYHFLAGCSHFVLAMKMWIACRVAGIAEGCHDFVVENTRRFGHSRIPLDCTLVELEMHLQIACAWEMVKKLGHLPALRYPYALVMDSDIVYAIAHCDLEGLASLYTAPLQSSLARSTMSM